METTKKTTKTQNKEIMLTGLQPTAAGLHLGNYFGAIRPLIQNQEKYDLFLFVADLHAITVPANQTKELFSNKLNIVATYLASGVDPKKSTIFFQSDVPGHSQLGWVMICNSTIGELSRMTQFKDKSSKFEMANGTSTIPAGLLTYPPLMAADIILYDAKYVPVGVDQTQHVELTRDLVIKFNKKFGKTFVEPEALVDKTAGAKILDLQNPTKKMSKSAESKNGVIFLNDTPEKGAEKINKALTDNLNKVKYDPINQPGISNLITIYKCLANVSTKEIETKYKDIPNYGSFKKDLGLLVKNFLTDFQEKFNGYIKNPETILKITDAAAKKCRKITDAKVVDVYQKIGLLPVKK